MREHDHKILCFAAPQLIWNVVELRDHGWTRNEAKANLDVEVSVDKANGGACVGYQLSEIEASDLDLDFGSNGKYVTAQATKQRILDIFTDCPEDDVAPYRNPELGADKATVVPSQETVKQAEDAGETKIITAPNGDRYDIVNGVLKGVEIFPGNIEAEAAASSLTELPPKPSYVPRPTPDAAEEAAIMRNTRGLGWCGGLRCTLDDQFQFERCVAFGKLAEMVALERDCSPAQDWMDCGHEGQPAQESRAEATKSTIWLWSTSNDLPGVAPSALTVADATNLVNHYYDHPEIPPLTNDEEFSNCKNQYPGLKQ